MRLPFLSRMTSLSRFYFQTFYSKMKLPWLKRTFLCHNQSKYFPEDYRHDNWDDSGQPGKRCLFWTAGRVDRKNLPLKMHLTWKMLRYLRRPNCTAWNQYVTAKSLLKFTWSNWSTLFCTFFFPLYSVTCMAVSEAAPQQFQWFLCLAYGKQKRKIRTTLIFQVVKNGVERTFKEGEFVLFHN